MLSVKRRPFYPYLKVLHQRHKIVDANDNDEIPQ